MSDGSQRAESSNTGSAIRRPLSVRLLWLTILAVMLAEILILLPSLAHFRLEWLNQKLDTVAVAGLAVEQSVITDGAVLEPSQQTALLGTLQAHLVAITTEGTTRLLARRDEIPDLDRQIDVGNAGWGELLVGALDTLFLGADRTIRVFGPAGGPDDAAVVAEFVMPENKLRHAMLAYARNLFLVSLGMAVFTALLVFAAINSLLVRPIRRLTQAMIRFGQAPMDATRIIAPSRRPDEIGAAEAELAQMQTALATTLREQRHLADLGLAVSKINHDLRNILGTAQMVSDRLSDVDDPRVQRTLPMLVRSLDRALVYTQSVLSYGKAVESAPMRRRVRLRRLVEDVFEAAPLGADSGIELLNAVPENAEVDVDADQFFRVISNLVRNAVQALDGDAGDILVRRVAVSAIVPNNGASAVIRVEDTGPGLPPRARENLFRAFRGSSRAGGTGLGLAIVAEIVEGHGGRIGLANDGRAGTAFEITLPPQGAPQRTPPAAEPDPPVIEAKVSSL